MILVFIISALIIAAAVLSIKYFKVYAKLTSYKSYDRAAKQEMKKIKYRDPKIVCDYCGVVIDTSRYKVCPQCGADYGRDDEWLERFKTDNDWIDEKADEKTGKEISKARLEAAKIAKKLKKVLIALGLLICALIILGIVIMIQSSRPNYAKSESLNESGIGEYKAVDYSIDGDGVILDKENVTVKVNGIYTNGYSGKLGYHISNHSDQDVQVRLEASAINNYASSVDFFSKYIKKGDEIDLYDYIPEIGSDTIIESIVFSEVEVRDSDYNEICKATDVRMTTTENKETPPKLSEGESLFDNDMITIVGIGRGGSVDSCYFEVLNKTDETIIIDLDGALLNDEELDAYGIYNETIPAGCILTDGYIHSYEEDYHNMTSEDKLYANFNVKCDDKPQKNFSTGYIEIK